MTFQSLNAAALPPYRLKARARLTPSAASRLSGNWKCQTEDRLARPEHIDIAVQSSCASARLGVHCQTDEDCHLMLKVESFLGQNTVFVSGDPESRSWNRY